jgi:hypothetical protein
VWIREANKEHPAAPTGLSPLAQGCAGGATLGNEARQCPTPTGLCRRKAIVS